MTDHASDCGVYKWLSASPRRCNCGAMTTAERGQLKAMNAELLKVLEILLAETKETLVGTFGENPDDLFDDVPVIKQARAVIARSKELTS